jgi:predicted O-linked N-acetylglucosamine transferase (SPINDLY family)
MDYLKFIEQLPGFYQHWQQPSVCPQSEQFSEIVKQLPGAATAKVLQLLNFAVACLATDEVYCEIGGEAATLVGALLNHSERLAYAVEEGSVPRSQSLESTIAQFGLESQVCLCQQEFESFFADLKSMEISDRIGVYFYNGAHDYRSQLLSLMLVKPFLADRALIVLTGSHWDAVQQATWDAIAVLPQLQLLDLPVADWGLQVLSWDVAANHTRAWNPAHRKPKFLQALSQSPATFYLQQGIVLEQAEDYAAAGQAWQQAIALDPDFLEPYHRLGNLVTAHGDPEQATLIYQASIARNPNNSVMYLDLGTGLLIQGRVEAAIAAYETGLAIDPQNNDLLNQLEFAQRLTPEQAHQFAAAELFVRQRYDAAVIHLQALLTITPDLEVFSILATCYEKTKNDVAVVETCRSGIQFFPSAVNLHRQLIGALTNLNQAEAAIAQATIAVQQFPDEPFFQVKQALTLPLLYQNEAEIGVWRDRFTQGLNQLTQTPLPSDRTGLQQALSDHTNFWLSYQNQNDLDLQIQYGQWFHQVTTDGQQPELQRPIILRKKLRIGYVSGCLWQHTVGKLIIGWWRQHDRHRFEIYSYFLLNERDDLNQEFRQLSDRWFQSQDLAAICQQIRDDRLDVLVFPEFGMQALVSQIAVQRLAPVQCTSWGHPVTSGLPTIDYFLSSDLMEPETGETHYSERLIRLPNLGICFTAPKLAAPTKSRAHWGLSEAAIVYLSCQMLGKMLPQQDAIFAAIAQQVPQAQFVFIARPNPTIAAQFLQRLQRAFAAVDLDAANHCLMLPPQNQADYWMLNQRSDIFLDSFGWSGGHTTLEAIACNLPVVTLPGEFMRGRHSYAILQQLGVTATIAQTPAAYIQIAVRLGQDAEFRNHLRQAIAQSHPNLYDDKTCVTALEAFYQSVAGSLLNDT